MPPEFTPNEMKRFIIDALALEDMRPEDIDDDEPLFREGLGLDSIDALELGVALKKQFPAAFVGDQTDTWNHLATVRSLVAFISRSLPAAGGLPTESCS